MKYIVKFQRFLYQTLCVFSQIKDMKHIEQYFHSVILIMPLWWDLRVLGGGGGTIVVKSIQNT